MLKAEIKGTQIHIEKKGSEETIKKEILCLLSAVMDSGLVNEHELIKSVLGLAEIRSGQFSNNYN